MCERFIIVESNEVIETRFNVHTKDIQIEKNHNLSPTQDAPIITCEDSNHIQLFKFGMVPSGSKKQELIINAQTKGIIIKPEFRKLIRSRRCLIIASAFIVGANDSGLDNPYLVYLQNKKRPFAMAGIYDTWLNPEGEKVNGFAIITTTANELLLQIGNPRMPVILHESNERTWINKESPLNSITRLLVPYPTNLMNAYPIDPSIKDPTNNYKELILPKGQRVQTEIEIKVEDKFIHHGYGYGKRNKGGGEQFSKK
jgi:putative SOS response-associated peptidase YedK